MEEVRFYDPDSKPFGPLSNIYPSKLKIERFSKGITVQQTYNSVDHYIYSNIMKNPQYAQKIVNVFNPRYVYKEYTQLEKKLDKETLYNSLFIAYTQVFSHPELRSKLLETKNTPLLYQDEFEDTVFGVDKKLSGENVVGNILMNVRKNIMIDHETKIVKSKRDDFFKKLFLIYLVHQHLELKIIKNESDLSEFLDQSFEQIAQENEKYLPLRNTQKYNSFLQLYHSNNLNLEDLLVILENPNITARLLRKKHLKDVNAVKEELFNKYMTQMIKLKNPQIKNIEYELELQLRLIPFTIQNELKERIYDLYLANKIQIQLRKKAIKQSEIEEASHFIIPKLKKRYEFINPYTRYEEDRGIAISIIKQRLEIYEKSQPIIFNNDNTYRFLSPRVYTIMIYIDNYPYPTPFHYFLTNLIMNIPKVKFEQARAMILKDTAGNQIDLANYKKMVDILEEYNNLKDSIIKNEKIRLAEIAMNIKFEDYDLRKLLYLAKTNIHPQFFYDSYDPILGTMGKDGDGENMVGKILKEISDNIRRFDIEEEEEFKLKSVEFTSLFLQNDIVRQWMEIRLFDLCRIIQIVENYVRKISKKSDKISRTQITKFVIGQLYSNCKNLVEGDIPQVPDEFISLVNKNLLKEGKETTNSEGTIFFIWEYIYTLLNVFTKAYIKNVNEELSNSSATRIIKSIGNNFLLLDSNCKGPYPESYKNCVFLSIRNICDKIFSFLKKNRLVTGFTYDTDLVLEAIKILLPYDENQYEILPSFIIETTPVPHEQPRKKKYKAKQKPQFQPIIEERKEDKEFEDELLKAFENVLGQEESIDRKKAPLKETLGVSILEKNIADNLNMELNNALKAVGYINTVSSLFDEDFSKAIYLKNIVVDDKFLKRLKNRSIFFSITTTTYQEKEEKEEEEENLPELIVEEVIAGDD